MIIVNRLRFSFAFVIATLLFTFAVNEAMFLLGTFAIWLEKII